MTKTSDKKIRKEDQDTTSSRSTAKKHFKKLSNQKSKDINSTENCALTPLVNESVINATMKTQDLSGFIFMCSGKTKAECYINRVFGLPSGSKQAVEKIKPGIKLFLYDYDAKLLYGVYEATSNGKMNLEPTAFGGMFPSQVKFKIYNDCLPLPLSILRSAIVDNYQGSKFSHELNSQQVRDLISLFRPIIVPPLNASLHHPCIPNAAPEARMIKPNVAPEPQMIIPHTPNHMLPLHTTSTGWINVNPSLTPVLQNPYTIPMNNNSPLHQQQRIIGPQPFQQNVINSPHLQHQAPQPYPHSPYQFAETPPPYNELPKIPQEPYPISRYTRMVELGGGENNKPPIFNHLHIQNHNSYQLLQPCYGSTHAQTPPPYTGPAYAQPQPPPSRSIPASSYYSFVGGVRLDR